MNSPTSPSVLIVDDEPIILALLTTALERQRISTAAAQDALEASALFEAHSSSIKVLISDVIMPETNGIQLAKRLLKRQPELKVLFVSGYCSTYESALRGFECLPKPFQVSELIEKVRGLLGQRRTKRLTGA